MDFLLAKQELIELIKARNVVAALGFATKNLAPFGEKNVRNGCVLSLLGLLSTQRSRMRCLCSFLFTAAVPARNRAHDGASCV